MPSKLDTSRDDIFEALRDGESQRTIAKQHGVARSTLQAFITNNAADTFFDTEGLSEEPTDNYVEIPVFVRDYRDHKELYVYPLGDVHLGSDAHAADRWKEWLDYLVNTPNATMIGTGDFLNTALKDSKSELYDETMRVGVAKRLLVDQLQALAARERIDILMPGNHEARIYRSIGDDPIQDVADFLDVNYAKDVCVLVYLVGSVAYEVYVRHGTGAGQVGARANRLQKQGNTLVADIYVSGHTHSQMAFQQDLFVVDSSGSSARVVRRRQTFVASGSFLNYEGYAANAGLAAQKIGAPRIRLDGRRKDTHVSI